MRELAARVAASLRAQNDLEGREHAIGVATGGGDLAIYVSDGRLRIEQGLPEKADFVMVAQEPEVLSRWVADGSLTDAAVEGKLWLPHKEAFRVLPILDRLPRSVRRDRG